VAEVVGAELHLEAVGRLPVRQRHHPRVVHQNVDSREAAHQGLGEAGHAVERREVERHHLEPGLR
jgi:hypothetical protein